MKKTLASIDIGSNAARLLIKKFNDEEVGIERVKKLMFCLLYTSDAADE